MLTILLVTSPGSDKLAAPAQLAASRLHAITGVNVNYWPIPTSVEAGEAGYIKIEVKAGANGGPCTYTAAEAFACTHQGFGPVGPNNSDMLSKQTIEIGPAALALTPSQLQSVVFHELGHAFGLEHTRTRTRTRLKSCIPEY